LHKFKESQLVLQLQLQSHKIVQLITFSSLKKH